MTLLVHIGYHKTATTWMQSILFQPRYGYQQIASHREVFEHVTKPHGLHFQPDPMQHLIMSRCAELPPQMTPVISSEILSGHPFFGGRGSKIYAQRLKKIAPDARILISIRAQDRILPSVYMQYLQRGGTMTAKQFFDGSSAIGYDGFDPEHFCYDALIETYQSLFDEVFVLPQEALRQDANAAAKALAAFSGNSKFGDLARGDEKAHAASPPEAIAPVLRRINHVRQSTLNPVPVIAIGSEPGILYRAATYAATRGKAHQFLKRHKPVSAFVADQFAGYFTYSNRRLAELTANQLDLSDYP